VPRYKRSAVARNRLKRRLRELVRLWILPADIAADIVLRARAEAYDAMFDALTGDVTRLRAQLLRWSAGLRGTGGPGEAAGSSSARSDA
jgi:ribonuclease P protein component